METEKTKIHSLQALRGIAALSVLIYHVKPYSARAGFTDGNIASHLSEFLGYGAMLFFAISGFIMSYLIDTNYKNFMFRRVLRIFPAFWIAVAMIILIKLLFFGSVEQPEFLQKISLLPLNVRTEYPLNIEWTLVYEMVFYLTCWVFTLKHVKKYFLPFLFVWLAFIFWGHYGLKLPVNIASNFKDVLLSTYNFYFIFGALSFYLRKVKISIPQKLCYLAILVATVLSFFIFKSMSDIRFFYIGILFGLIVYFMSHINIKKENILSVVGNYSYGLYLVHAQVLFILFSSLQTHLVPINNYVVIIVFLITLGVGIAYGKFEVHLHKSLKNIKLSKTLVYRTSFIAGSIFVLMSINTFYSSIQMNSLRTSVIFNQSEVSAKEQQIGWVDSMTKVDGKGLVTLTGWDIDPVSKKPSNNIIILLDGKQTFPSSIKRKERNDVVKLYNSPISLLSGWTATLDTKTMGKGNHKIDAYVKTENGSIIKLSENKPLILSL